MTLRLLSRGHWRPTLVLKDWGDAWEEVPRAPDGRWETEGDHEATKPMDTGVLGSRAAAGLESGGFTLHPYSGSAPTTGYQVAMTGRTQQYPAADMHDTEALTRAFDDFLSKNSDILTPGGNVYIGGWEEGGQLWLEPSENIESRDDAVALGQSRDQIAIWDNANGQAIDTGGSGGLGESGKSARAKGLRGRGPRGDPRARGRRAPPGAARAGARRAEADGHRADRLTWRPHLVVNPQVR
jgi:hypothetical protein